MNSEEKRDKTECHDFYKLLEDCKNKKDDEKKECLEIIDKIKDNCYNKNTDLIILAAYMN